MLREVVRMRKKRSYEDTVDMMDDIKKVEKWIRQLIRDEVNKMVEEDDE
jgi:hypothetical protein